MAFLWRSPGTRCGPQPRNRSTLLSSQDGAPRKVGQPAARDRLSGPADLVYAPCERQTIWEGSHRADDAAGRCLPNPGCGSGGAHLAIRLRGAVMSLAVLPALWAASALAADLSADEVRARIEAAGGRCSPISPIWISPAWQLAGIDFQGADLRGTVLKGANLEGADLSDANLDLVILRDANLKGATLPGASAFRRCSRAAISRARTCPAPRSSPSSARRTSRVRPSRRQPRRRHDEPVDGAAARPSDQGEPRRRQPRRSDAVALHRRVRRFHGRQSRRRGPVALRAGRGGLHRRRHHRRAISPWPTSGARASMVSPAAIRRSVWTECRRARRWYPGAA